MAHSNAESFKKTDKMIEITADLWKDQLDEAAYNSYSKKGYYVQKLSLKDGTLLNNVNIISINSNVCYVVNYYLWKERNDPGDELDWLT